MSIPVAIVNRSTVITDAAAALAVAALQIQATRDFAPHYGGAALVFVGLKETPPDGTAQVVLLDNSDQAGDLGYHELTADGLPIAKVFCKDDVADGVEWSVTLSHELLEMLADPNVDKTAAKGDGTRVAYEVGDAVEDDRYAYSINGVMVSDFVLPSYFDDQAGLAPFDFGGHVDQAFQLLPGGYESREDANGNWTETMAARATDHPSRHERAMVRGSSRLLKRRKPKADWQRSAA